MNLPRIGLGIAISYQNHRRTIFKRHHKNRHSPASAQRRAFCKRENSDANTITVSLATPATFGSTLATVAVMSTDQAALNRFSALSERRTVGETIGRDSERPALRSRRMLSTLVSGHVVIDLERSW